MSKINYGKPRCDTVVLGACNKICALVIFGECVFASYLNLAVISVSLNPASPKDSLIGVSSQGFVASAG